MIMRISALLTSVVALLAPLQVTADKIKSRSMPVLDKSDPRRLFSNVRKLKKSLGAIFSGAGTAKPVLNPPSPDLSELKEMRADIWQDDIRASAAIHRMCRFRGIGIGLSIWRTIVRSHKGRMRAENGTGRGAMFSLPVPLALS
jgi:hypothetical protein